MKTTKAKFKKGKTKLLANRKGLVMEAQMAEQKFSLCVSAVLLSCRETKAIGRIIVIIWPTP